MDTSERMVLIEQRLKDAFSPTHLKIQDDSAQHKGHAGSRDGAGHYTIFIKADCFNGLSRVHVHRKIYKILNDMIPLQIHALQIKIL